MAITAKNLGQNGGPTFQEANVRGWICNTATHKLSLNTVKFDSKIFDWNDLWKLSTHLTKIGFTLAPTLPNVTGLSEDQKYDV